jgi:hypothetical protein
VGSGHSAAIRFRSTRTLSERIGEMSKRQANRTLFLCTATALVVGGLFSLGGTRAADNGNPIVQQLAELKQQRLKTAQRVNSDHQQAFEADTVSVDALIGAMRKLSEAERAIATTPKAELSVLQEYVHRLKLLYAKVYPPVKIEPSERNDYPTVRLEIETAEVAALEFRLRAKL